MTTNKTSVAATKVTPKKSAVKKSTTPPAETSAKSAVKSAVKAVDKKPKKEAKVKVIRDSFTMPQSEYQKIAEIKETCLKAGLHVKKSEVLRAGLKALGSLSDTQLKRALSSLEKIKTGRPIKSN
jgi:hypothetical protein